MHSPLIPGLVYHDARAAIEWLGKAFGYERWFVVEDGDEVIHAELRLGAGILIIDPAAPDAAPPTEGDRPSHIYTVVDDVDLHAARAVAAGAGIVDAPAAQPYGGRTYSCADLEGYVWGFGSYDPWTSRAQP